MSYHPSYFPLYLSSIPIEGDSVLYTQRSAIHDQLESQLRALLFNYKFGEQELKNWLIQSISGLNVRSATVFDHDILRISNMIIFLSVIDCVFCWD
mgnify:CR=1 FL=1